MTRTITQDGYRWTTCPECGGDGYSEQLDLAAIKPWMESPPYCKVACNCEDGLSPVGCEECGEHLADDEGEVCAVCVAAAEVTP